MHALRLHLKFHRWLAALLVGAALLIKVLVPAGFMPVFSARSVTIQLCSGFGPEITAMNMAGMPGMDHHGPDNSQHGGKETPCGFGGLALPSLSGAAPILLAVAFRYILMAGLSAETGSVAASTPHLRPPLRGPPGTA